MECVGMCTELTLSMKFLDVRKLSPQIKVVADNSMPPVVAASFKAGFENRECRAVVEIDCRERRPGLNNRRTRQPLFKSCVVFCEKRARMTA